MSNLKGKILSLIIIIFATIFIVNLSDMLKWLDDSKKTKEEIKKIEDIVEVQELKDDEGEDRNIEIIEQPEEIDEANPYWDYIYMPLINVDFTDLKNQNSDTVGWLQVNGTNINYPVVKTDNNDYYLTHSFNKSYNEAGWVFMDYRNNLEQQNTIIYAHGRADQVMFHTLKNILSSEWVNDTNNHVIKLSTEKENTLWQVFSVYVIPTTNDYLKVYFKSDSEFEEFANKLKNRSQFNFNTTVSGSDKILTLSTCYDDSKKTVLHAKLIKRESR